MRRTEKTRKIKRTLAWLLSASLALEPVPVLAVEVDRTAIQNVEEDSEELVWQEESMPDVQLADEEEVDPPEENKYPIEEVEAYRTANEKQYRMSDGSMEVQVYPEAVHYEQDGTWLAIDNTLHETGEGTYKNGANSYQAVFSDGSNDQDELVSSGKGTMKSPGRWSGRKERKRKKRLRKTKSGCWKLKYWIWKYQIQK